MQKLFFSLITIILLSVSQLNFATPAAEHHKLAQQQVASLEEEPHAIAKRLHPIGKVNVESKTTENQSTTTPTNTSTPAASERIAQIYQSKCSICHASGVANAPKFGNKADWQKRFTDTNKKNVADQKQALLTSIKQGKGAMPAKATCDDCTDAEYLAAIEYMMNGGK